MKPVIWKMIRWFGTIVIPAVITLVACVLYLPIPELDRFEEIKTLNLGTVDLENVTIAEATAYLDDKFRAAGAINFSVRLAEHVQVDDYPYISLQLSDLEAIESLRYVTELTGLRYYPKPDGVIVDRRHADHRSTRRKLRDWLRYDVLSFWYGSYSN